MFVWDFIMGDMLDQMIEWCYGQVVGGLVDFFGIMGNMGVELFDMKWVQSIVLFFSYLGWALFVVGLVVAIFETAIEHQSGRGSIKDTGINIIKGFMATSLFSVVPIELYKLSHSLQLSLTAGLTGSDKSMNDLAITILESVGTIAEVGDNGAFGISAMTNPLLILFIIIMMGYAVVKVFFANLKRGGIMLIQISVGSLYMFSVPRGYTDGFIGWCKQIIALCLTAFLQITILTAGLMVIPSHCLLGLGLMLSAGEVPRIADAFGLETSTKGNMMGAVQTASMAVNTTRTIIQTVPK